MMRSQIKILFASVCYFVWSSSAFSTVELQPHPQAKNGLIRIEEDGTYIYKQESITRSQTIGARVGMLTKPDVQGNRGQTYQSIYGGSSLLGLMGEYAHDVTVSFGHLGWQVGGGFATVQGHGILSESQVQAEEKYNLFVLPLSAGLTYRFEYKDKQLLVPYVNAGLTYFGMVEKRDDDKPPAFAGAPAAYQSGGVYFCVSCIDRASSSILAEDYGISSLAVMAEVRYYEGLSREINFTGLSYSAGIAFDF